MEENKREFLGTICNVYLTVLLAVLPLYTKGTYYLLGDAKYLLFRNVSFVCLGLWIGMWAVWLAVKGAGFAVKALKRSKSNPQKRDKRIGGNQIRRISAVDFFVAAYGIAAVLSLFFSAYPQTAWAGYRDWYMGALSQLLFVGIYFFVSRNYTGCAWPVYLGEAALLIVSFVGVLNRLRFDPLKLLAPFRLGDWEYSHMLSTMGNINWLCGYYSVVLGFSVTGFLYGENRRLKTCFLYIISVLSMMILCIQGSVGGLLIAAGCIGICLLFGVKRPTFFEKGILLAAGTVLSVAVMAVLVILRKSMAAMPGDGNIYEKIPWPVWWLAGFFILLVYFAMGKMTQKVKTVFIRISVAFLIAMTLVSITFYLTGMEWNDSWGSRRGVLWRLAWEGFLQADWLKKLVGVGPDCYAEYIYSIFPARQLTVQNSYWQNVTFANAHNEWLNMLTNMGILGVAGYLGIFLSGLRRYRGMMIGVFAILLYGAHSLLGFQQTVNTPLLFAVLGICESRVRRADIVSQGQ